MTPEYWDERIAVNLKHQIFAAQTVLLEMMRRRSGAIINFGSTSWMVGHDGITAYTAAKSAILGLPRSLARDFGSYNMSFNAVAPGCATPTSFANRPLLTRRSRANLSQGLLLQPDDKLGRQHRERGRS